MREAFRKEGFPVFLQSFAIRFATSLFSLNSARKRHRLTFCRQQTFCQFQKQKLHQRQMIPTSAFDTAFSFCLYILKWQPGCNFL